MIEIQFPQTLEYAIRAMTCLTRLRPGESLKATEISEQTHVPVHYLSKIMRKMVQAKLVHSQKGHGGGFSLAKEKGQIRFMDIMEAAEYGDNSNHCVFGWGQCKDGAPCPIHDSWSQLKTYFREWAQNTTLENVDNGLPLLKPADHDQLPPARDI